ncbi:hypothetical protein [Chondromyces crocatus]|uniref:Lipoprotein n=1 Tax=Chondromyces crocatus TaxID=52 RepID=A0A0K1E7C6_CHOCO|nr:hypothetical protein [Chondromyces crocatus]AKT36786.1 uncharacterized protein CMC5_009070 [Chondromyces crocatus]
MVRQWIVIGTGWALAALTSGCLVSVDGNPVSAEPTGEMVFNWTVDNSTSPRECATYATPGSSLDLEFVLLDDRGNTVTVEYADCESFSLSLVISAEQYYHAEVTMVDAADHSMAKSTTETLSSIWVEPETTVDLSVNFPPSSML